MNNSLFAMLGSPVPENRLIRKVTLLGVTIMLLLAPLSTKVIASPSQVNLRQVDAKIAKSLHDIARYQETRGDKDYDQYKSIQMNIDLLHYLQKVDHDPRLLSAPLKRAADAGLKILTAPDKKIRFYSWDTLTGGTMIFYYSLAQYQPENEKQSRTLNLSPTEPGPDRPEDRANGFSYDELHELHTSEGKTVYVGMAWQTSASQIHCARIWAYAIKGAKLVPVPFFQSPKEVVNSMLIGSDIIGSLHIGFTKDGKTLSVPLLDQSDMPKNKVMVYKFDGHRFVSH